MSASRIRPGASGWTIAISTVIRSEPCHAGGNPSKGASRGRAHFHFSACSVVGDGDRKPEDIAEAVLKSAHPSVDAVGVAAAAICEDDELGGVGLAGAAFSAPLGIQVFNGDEGGVGGDAGVAEAPD